jgi:hypothetical protein
VLVVGDNTTQHALFLHELLCVPMLVITVDPIVIFICSLHELSSLIHVLLVPRFLVSIIGCVGMF